MRQSLILIVLLVLIIFTSCESEDQIELIEVKQDKVIYTQIDRIHNYDDIEKILSEKCSFTELCDVFDVREYKYNQGSYYIVINTTEGLQIVLFDASGENGTMYKISFSHIENETLIKELEIGMSIDNAKNADPDGKYEFLLHDSSHYPNISYHFFENGDCYAIKYENGIIAEIVHFTI